MSPSILLSAISPLVPATSHPWPVDGGYQVSSNILRDLESLRLLAKVLPLSSAIGGVLHLDVTLVLFSLVAAAPHPRPVNTLVIDFMSMVSLLCALQLFIGAGNLLLASSDVQPFEMCCVTISLSRVFHLGAAIPHP